VAAALSSLYRASSSTTGSPLTMAPLGR
jgi:hypothetical protein